MQTVLLNFPQETILVWLSILLCSFVRFSHSHFRLDINQLAWLLLKVFFVLSNSNHYHVTKISWRTSSSTDLLEKFDWLKPSYYCIMVLLFFFNLKLSNCATKIPIKYYVLFINLILLLSSSRGGLEVERLLHKLHDSISVGSNTAWHQKDFRIN